MPIFTVPVHECALQEFNPCHEPGGSPSGGQFAQKGSGDCGGSQPSPVERNRARENFTYLKDRYARLDNALRKHLNDPDSPAARSLEQSIKAVVKEAYKLKADTGGLEGIGLPGGPRDVVVIGAGPGGMTAAIHAGYEELDVLLLDAADAPGGQPKRSSRIQNYPGFPIGASGREISEKMFEQVQQNGAEAKLGVKVTGITVHPDTEMKTITLSNGETVEARTVVLATGLSARKASFKGAESVLYDAEELAARSAGKSVVVVGGSNAAAQAALGAGVKAAHVTVIARSSIDDMSGSQKRALRADPRKFTIIEGAEIAELSGGEAKLTTGQRVKADVTAAFLGGVATTSWLPKELGLINGRVHVDLHDTEITSAAGKRTRHAFETSLPGVFAVGDIRFGSGTRIAAAVGDGAMAIRSVFPYLAQLQGRRGKKAKP